MKIVISLATPLVFAISTVVNASQIDTCPSLDALASPIDFSQTSMIAPDTAYTYMAASQLKTDKLWAIFVSPVKGSWSNTEDEAIKILSHLSSPGEVKYSNDMEEYYCSYATNDNTYVSAFQVDMDALATKKNFLNKNLQKSLKHSFSK